MRKLIVFNNVTLDAYFADLNGDMSWAHKHDAEWKQFVHDNASGGGELLFGRITYQLMASYWPSPLAMKNDPAVAEGMNKAEKIVFSRTLKQVGWNNTRLVKDNIGSEIRNLKKTSGKDMTLLGSGSILTQFAEEGLIDEFQFMVDPVALKNIKRRLNLKLTSTRTFKNGTVLLSYQPD